MYTLLKSKLRRWIGSWWLNVRSEFSGAPKCPGAGSEAREALKGFETHALSGIAPAARGWR
jgi:hypothetical protein